MTQAYCHNFLYHVDSKKIVLYKLGMTRKDKKGKPSTHSTEEQMAKEVMNLFQSKTILTIRINHYQKHSEAEKEMLCDLFREITLCKIPARDNKNDLIFYLGKEARV